jgi:thiol-disulfide isomerase/thioredoxin
MRERWAGRALLGLLAALFAVNAVWIARHGDELRPLGQGDLAPSVPLPLIDGGGMRALADLKGKVVLVDFWATWCGPCEKTIPMQKRLYQKYAEQGFDVWSVNEDQGAGVNERVSAYARRFALPFPVVHDTGGAAAELYGVDVFPTMLLVGRDGRVKRVEIGVLSVSRLEDQLDEAIRAAL